jgi:hypothetical protein
MKKMLLTNDNLPEIKEWVGKSKFVLILNSAYWTKTGTSPYRSSAQLFTRRFFSTELCKTMIKDEAVKIALA